jgi:hypothetical protein
MDAQKTRRQQYKLWVNVPFFRLCDLMATTDAMIWKERKVRTGKKNDDQDDETNNGGFDHTHTESCPDAFIALLTLTHAV